MPPEGLSAAMWPEGCLPPPTLSPRRKPPSSGETLWTEPKELLSKGLRQCHGRTLSCFGVQ